MIEQLQQRNTLRQLVIATPLFKGMHFLEEMEKPWSFNTQTTPYYNAQSPSMRSISHLSLSPSLPALSHRLRENVNVSRHSPSRPLTAFELTKRNNSNNNIKVPSSYDLELGSLGNVGRQASGSNLSTTTISLDSDDEDESTVGINNDDTLRIVCYSELIKKEWFTKQFTGDNVMFDGQRNVNPWIETEFKKLNPIFVQEMKRTTHMFLLSFPFFEVNCG